MAPSRRKGASKAAATAAARRQWKVGDLVLAKVKGFPAWPATVSEPEKWGYSSDWKKVLVYFFGTKQIAFCNPADVEEFTEEKKQSLLGKRHGRSSDFVRAVQEIVDSYDKLKENNQVDQLDSGDTPAENAVVGSLIENNIEVADTTNDSRVKSSSSKLEDEPSHTGEDVGALTEVDSLNKRDVAEDPDHIACPLSIPLPNTYTLRKKSRSVQPQRCASKKKVSVQRSRSSSGVESHGLQNGVIKFIDGRSSGDGGLNGFWDGPLRRAKRSKRSPDGSVPNVGDSSFCNSNGTIEDNGSEIAMADFETLSNNNEGSAIESYNKRDQSEGGSELKQRLDLPVNSGIIRKKRNPGRRRALNDGLESISRVDQEPNKKIIVAKDTVDLPTLCTHWNGNHSKDESDEHLPLVKRARVRMGKILSGEHREQHDCLIKTEEKTLQTVPGSTSMEVCTTMNCDDVLIEKMNCDDVSFLENLLIVNESIACSPSSNCAEIQEKDPQTLKINYVVTDKQTGFLYVDNCAQIPDNRSLPLKIKESQPYGCAFDGEAALPPSKRLHRALEAMSANAAEEIKTSVKVSVPVSLEADKAESCLPLVSTYADIVVEDEAGNALELQNLSPTCHNALNNESSGAPSSPNQLRCEIVGSDVYVVDSSSRNLDCLKGQSLLVDAAEIALLSDNKDVSGTVGTKESKSYCQEKVVPVTCCIVDDPDMLGLGDNTLLSQLPSNEFCKGEEDAQPCVLEKNNSNCITYPERVGKNIAGEYEAVDVGYHAGTTVYLSQKKEEAIMPVEDKHALQDVNMEVSCSAPQQTCDSVSVSGGRSQDQTDQIEVDVHDHVSHPNDLTASSSNNNNHRKYLSDDDDESKSLDADVNHPSQSWERINLAEVKAAIASLELTLGSLTRTKESIGRATKIAIDCVKFGIAADVVDLLVLYLEKESLAYKRVDLFFLVDSIAQCSRGLKGEVGDTYISAVKETLGRILAAAAPAGPAGKENRRQCLKVLRLWLDRRMLPDSIVLQHIRELESQNCSTSGYSRRMSRTERSFDDPLRDMEGMLVDEYGSNSSFQMPGFCMPRMLKEEDDGSDSDGGSFEAVTPEHDSRQNEIHEESTLAATGKHRHILEEVDGELEMEDVAPCEVEVGPTAPSSNSAVLTTQCSREQFTSFIPPLPHEVPPRAPPLPSSPPPPPPPPPPAPLIVSNGSIVPHVNNDSQLHISRNNMQETMAPRPPAPSIHHPMPMPEPTSSCSYNSYPVMHNPVPPSGNNIQPPDANLFGQHYNSLRPPPYPSPSNQFSYFQPDQQIRPQRQVPPPPPPPPYYERPANFPQNVEGGHFYGEQDNIRPPPRHEAPDGWGYSRPQFHGSTHPDNDKGCLVFSGMSCEPTRPPPNQGWGFPPHPVHHRNHIPTRPPCDGPVHVTMRAPAYWRPR